jgi:hypothetical protein
VTRALQAKQVWDWLQWRLPADVWMEAQQVLTPTRPTPSDPVLAAGLTEILAPETTQTRRIQLLQQLLTIIKNNESSK